jgi:hypothetical protein
MELAFAGLHQLCAPMLGDLERLPGPQRNALRVALGLQPGDAPDPFLVALAALSLLAEVAEASPLVCLIDDAQWLDQASARTLTFVARRLLAERIAMVFGVRESGEPGPLDDLPQLVVEELADADARLLRSSAIPGLVDERVRDRIVAEARGNPLALMEPPRGFTSAALAGGFGLPDTMPLASRVEAGFMRRLEPLPIETRRLLLAAAIDPVGDVTLLRRAAERLGIGVGAAAAAEAAGLVEIGARVRFRHPLVRSAVYRAASLRIAPEVNHRTSVRARCTAASACSWVSLSGASSSPWRRWPSQSALSTSITTRTSPSSNAHSSGFARISPRIVPSEVSR